MSLKPSYSSPSSNSFSSSSSLIDHNEDVVIRKPSIGIETSTLSSGRLPQQDAEGEKLTSSSRTQNKESGGRAFLSVKKNAGLLKSHMVDNNRDTSGKLKLRHIAHFSKSLFMI